MAKFYLREHAISDKGRYPLTINGRATKAYKVWYSMLDRCYLNLDTAPSYRKCKVCQKWFYFQNFAKWFYKNYREGFHLDKDILKKGNNTYSPKNCIFVPQNLNSLLTDHRAARGVYPQGVSRVSTPTPTFASTLSINGKQKHLGSFKSVKSAFDVYKKAKEAYVKELALKHFELGNIDILTLKALQKWEL